MRSKAIVTIALAIFITACRGSDGNLRSRKTEERKESEAGVTKEKMSSPQEDPSQGAPHSLPQSELKIPGEDAAKISPDTYVIQDADKESERAKVLSLLSSSVPSNFASGSEAKISEGMEYTAYDDQNSNWSYCMLESRSRRIPMDKLPCAVRGRDSEAAWRYLRDIRLQGGSVQSVLNSISTLLTAGAISSTYASTIVRAIQYPSPVPSPYYTKESFRCAAGLAVKYQAVADTYRNSGKTSAADVSQAVSDYFAASGLSIAHYYSNRVGVGLTHAQEIQKLRDQAHLTNEPWGFLFMATLITCI